MKAERPALVRDPHRPVPMLFPQHTGGSDRRMILIESSLMRNGAILAQAVVVLKHRMRSNSLCAGRGRCRSATWAG